MKFFYRNLRITRVDRFELNYRSFYLKLIFSRSLKFEKIKKDKGGKR